MPAKKKKKSANVKKGRKPLDTKEFFELSENDGDDLNVAESQEADLTRDIRKAFNELMLNVIETTPENQPVGGEEDNRNQSSKINVFLLNSVVSILTGHDFAKKKQGRQSQHAAKDHAYPYSFIEAEFIDFLERILTLETKDYILKRFLTIPDQIYMKIVKSNLCSEKTQNGYKLLERALNHLCLTYLTPNLPLGLQTRTAILISQIVFATKGTFKLQKRSKGQQHPLVFCIIDMIHQQQKANMQSLAIQMATVLYDAETCHEGHDILFNNLIICLPQSKFKESRRKIIKLMKVPHFLNDEDVDIGEKAKYLKMISQILQQRLTDEDSEVRQEAYLKIAKFKIRIEDFPKAETRMIIIKEGMTDKDPRVKAACLQFLKVSVIEKIGDDVPENHRSRRRSNISYIKKRDSQEDEMSQVPQNVDSFKYNFCKLYKQINIKNAFIDEYFQQVPFVIMQIILMIVREENKVDEDPALILAAYAEQMLEKFKIQAGCVDLKQLDSDYVFDIEPQEIIFEEVLFLRIFFEFSKWQRSQYSPEYLQKLESLELDFDTYSQIFQFFLRNLPHQADGKTQENRLILNEWLKFSLQMNVKEPTIKSDLVRMLLNFVGEIEHSFADYRYMMKDGCYRLDNNGNERKTDADMLFEEPEVVPDDGEFLNIVTRQFEDLEVHREVQEYMKPFTCELFIRDIDDVCLTAVIIVKRLMDSDPDAEFNREMLQIIQEVSESLNEKSEAAELAEQQAKDEEVGVGFGLAPQVNPYDQQPEVVVPTLKELRKTFQAKFNEKRAAIEALGQQSEQDDGSEEIDQDHLNKILKKIIDYNSIMEEINLKEKLTFKRSMNLCLILLKCCKPHTDETMVEICQSLIQPALQATEDKDNHLLAIESIGLLSLLDEELFNVYSRIFQTFLQDEARQANKVRVSTNHEDLFRRKLAILSLMSSFDGLIYFGSNSQTNNLQQLICKQFTFSPDKGLRQITIEGICKLLFGTKITKNQSVKKEEDQENDQSTLIVNLLSHLLIQWFDKKFNSQKSLVSQTLSTFFSSFALFSLYRCELMLKALVQVSYSILVAKFDDELERKNKKGKNKRAKRGGFDSDEDDYGSDSDSDEEYRATKKPEKVTLEEICSSLDLVQIARVFMTLLNQEYIKKEAPQDIRLTQSLTTKYFINLCNINNSIITKTNVTKSVISPIIDHVRLQEVSCLSTLLVLHTQAQRCCDRLVGGPAKLKFRKFLEDIEKRAFEMQDMEIAIPGEEAKIQKEEGAEVLSLGQFHMTVAEYEQKLGELTIKRADLDEYFQHQIEKYTVYLVQEDIQNLNILRVGGEEVSSEEKNFQTGSTQEARRMRNSRASAARSAEPMGLKTSSSLRKDPFSGVAELSEQERRQNRTGTSKKLVRFDEDNTRVKNLQKAEIVELEDEEDISETSYAISQGEGYGKAVSSRGKLTALSQKQVKNFLQSKRKEARRSRSPDSIFGDSASQTLGVGSVLKITRDKHNVAIEVLGESQAPSKSSNAANVNLSRTFEDNEASNIHDDSPSSGEVDNDPFGQMEKHFGKKIPAKMRRGNQLFEQQEEMPAAREEQKSVEMDLSFKKDEQPREKRTSLRTRSRRGQTAARETSLTNQANTSATRRNREAAQDTSLNTSVNISAHESFISEKYSQRKERSRSRRNKE